MDRRRQALLILAGEAAGLDSLLILDLQGQFCDHPIVFGYFMTELTMRQIRIGKPLHTGKTFIHRKMLPRHNTISIFTTAPLTAHLIMTLNLHMTLRLTEADMPAIEAIIQTTVLIAAIPALDPTLTTMGPRSVAEEASSATFNGLPLGLEAAVVDKALIPDVAMDHRPLQLSHRL